MTNDELKNKIFYLYKNNISITKPEGTKFVILNIDYTKIGNQKVEGFQYSDIKKYVPFETLFKCFEQLNKTGLLSREWFRTNFTFENSSRPCNFSIIGSIFVKLDLAYYEANGEYKKK